MINKPDPLSCGMLRVMGAFERCVVVALLAVMMVAIVAATIRLGCILAHELYKPPRLLLEVQQVSEIFGFVFMVLIGLELLETVKTYLSRAEFHVEVVFLVAMIAVARKVILLDVKELDATALLGIAAVILSLACGFFFLKKARRVSEAAERDCSSAAGERSTGQGRPQ